MNPQVGLAIVGNETEERKENGRLKRLPMGSAR